MLEELNVYLRGNTSDDYWYDNALFICEEILIEFSDNDWESLMKILPLEDDQWKIKLAECLGNIHNNYEVKCLLELIETTNNDLFIACVDSLRNIDLSSINNSEKKVIIDKVNYIKENNSSSPVKKILEDFLKKCQILK